MNFLTKDNVSIRSSISDGLGLLVVGGCLHATIVTNKDQLDIMRKLMELRCYVDTVLLNKQFPIYV